MSLLGATQLALAVEPVTGEAELGYVATTGNTETSSVKGKVSVVQDLEQWKNNYELDALYKEERIEVDGEKRSEVSAERYYVSAQGNYKLNQKHSALFVFASYEHDAFSGYEHQRSVSVGYADQLFGDDVSSLKYNIGPGYFHNEQDNGRVDEGGILRVAADYRYNLSATAKFKQLLSSEIALEEGRNTKSKSETSIAASLIGSLSLKASYAITHNTEVPEGNENMDTITSVSVLYIF